MDNHGDSKIVSLLKKHQVKKLFIVYKLLMDNHGDSEKSHTDTVLAKVVRAIIFGQTKNSKPCLN